MNFNLLATPPQARECKFHSAGREDIDVRMLGDGRPFALELIGEALLRVVASSKYPLLNHDASSYPSTLLRCQEGVCYGQRVGRHAARHHGKGVA